MSPTQPLSSRWHCVSSLSSFKTVVASAFRAALSTSLTTDRFRVSPVPTDCLLLSLPVLFLMASVYSLCLSRHMLLAGRSCFSALHLLCLLPPFRPLLRLFLLLFLVSPSASLRGPLVGVFCLRVFIYESRHKGHGCMRCGACTMPCGARCPPESPVAHIPGRGPNRSRGRGAPMGGPERLRPYTMQIPSGGPRGTRSFAWKSI